MTVKKATYSIQISDKNTISGIKHKNISKPEALWETLQDGKKNSDQSNLIKINKVYM